MSPNDCPTSPEPVDHVEPLRDAASRVRNVLSGLAIEPHKVAGLRMLMALDATGKHVYAGTVPAHVTARRRARNKVARASRKRNR